LAGAGEGEGDLTGVPGVTGVAGVVVSTVTSGGAVVQCRECGIESAQLLYAGVIASTPVNLPCSLEHKVSSNFFHALRSLSVS
jgi:hypothetical protein